jgi:hypothetical protein
MGFVFTAFLSPALAAGGSRNVAIQVDVIQINGLAQCLSVLACGAGITAKAQASKRHVSRHLIPKIKRNRRFDGRRAGQSGIPNLLKQLARTLAPFLL